ncbi:MAG: ribonuclease J [Bacilli bacterium]|nr:ribonuclease J [Bacilli bacterium]
MIASEAPINIYALGGLGEVGKNTYCFESEKNLIIVDAGIRFPEASLPGVNYVIPDYSFLKNNRAKIKALFITHGHEDHIGGIPFLLRTITIPVIYAPRLAAALIRKKLEEHKIKDPVNIVEIDEKSFVKIGEDFVISFFRVTHSIPDAYGVCIDTKHGRIIETGDFKIDLTPVGPKFEIDKLTRLGTEGVDLLMADSTNAELEGYTPSETAVRKGVEEIFEKAPARIIVSTFSSNINRIQQVVEVAIAHNRKLCILGRSMKNVIAIAREYGYIKIPDESLIEDSALKNYKLSEICILCTGSQGETTAALSRIVAGENKYTTIYPGDTVVFSSNPIPGNGILVDRLVNKIVKMGADVKQNSLAFSLHSSGHPSRQELRLIQALVRPNYFMPVHGEYRMLKLHGDIAISMGMPKDHVFICDNGEVLSLKNHVVTRAHKVQADDIYIDGTNLDGVNNTLINDRSIIRNDGIIIILVSFDKGNNIIGTPKILTKGFAVSPTTHVVRHSLMRATEAIDAWRVSGTPFGEIKNMIKNNVAKYVDRKTGRKPMIIPIILTEN